MSTLKYIARTYADEIRDGIAWVIVWKTGKSWHAEAVWLDPETEKFEVELDDLDMANQILEADPKAVMLNGYYCRGFWEDMGLKDIEASIRWHYENGCNLLKNSDAFPSELTE